MTTQSSSSNDSFIRPYNPQTDHEAVVHVFRETCDTSLHYEPARTIGEYLWCRPYVALSPETCFVVDDGTGRAVGYCIGTPNTSSFNAAWASQFVPQVRSELDALADEHRQTSSGLNAQCQGLLENVRDPVRANYGDLAAELAPYSAHLHIDILPSHQNQGLGKHLLKALLDSVRSKRASGVYLGMTAHNDGAGRFYARNGFKRLPYVLDGGKSGEEGRTPTRPDGGATIYWVLDSL